MDLIGHQRKYAILLMKFLVVNTIVSQEPPFGNTVNFSSGRQFPDVLGQLMLPSWYYTSIEAVPKHDTVSHNRWRTQRAFSKMVYSFHMKEDTIPGTVVGKVEKVFESLTPITYSVQEDDGENLFLLNPFSGDFLLSRSLDFEAQNFYILTVAVWLGDMQVSSVRAYFNVLDVNDNPPVFSQDTLTASLLEDTRVGTCFLSLNVSDKDDGDSGDLQLKVIAGNKEEAFFMNPAGSLCLNAQLDRERQSYYNLTLTANDCVKPASLQFTSTTHVMLLVDDVNDNAPLFVSAKIARVPEDAALHSVIMTVHADDEDVGFNGEVLYYLKTTASALFTIDNRSGKIYLEESLDREQVDTLSITVTATDRGSPAMATTVNITVYVEDANDHNPEFSETNVSLTVREDVPRGTSLLRVQALDRDIGANGQVRYVLPRTSPFVVDTVRGVITVMDKLDRERDSNYSLTLTAVDQGDIPRRATALISVTVLDVNDFAPLFTPETLTIHVLENEEDPSQLTHQLSAMDEDLGLNSQLTYFIQKRDSDGLLSITPSGMFNILQSLDRERESFYFAAIIAVDSGLPPLTGTLTVHIIVDDINDNRPEFTEDAYNTIVSEDSPPGTVFAMISASDIDEGVNGKIRYSMENRDSPFAIDEISGELFTTDVLDRETVSIYSVTVIGSDKHPTQPLSSSVLVTVLIGDINDHSPQFMNSPYMAYVPTEMDPGSVVCAVRATDGDTEMNADLHYSLNGQSSDLFSINPHSGTVVSSNDLRMMEDTTVHVHVQDAGDNPKSDTTNISIRFYHAFEFPKMNIDVLSDSLSEDDPVGTLVAVVSAVSTRVEPVSFYLVSGNFEDKFHVAELTGELSVKNPLDYENQKEFTLLLEARDSGSPPFSSFAEIHLNISDVNDNFPQFIQVEYRCEVFENSPPSWVCDVLAIDADSGSYGTVQYNLTQGNTEDVFTIDPESGLLSTISSLDREMISVFNLTVEAEELNNHFHKSIATVIVAVLDRNDNPPRFVQIFLTEVPEDCPVGCTVIQVTSTDSDTGTNAVINYKLIEQSASTPFDINFTTGYITVGRPLDREIQDHYTLKVNANDSAWSISTEVSITILDINDNRPVFSEQLYTVVLAETKDKEVFVVQVLAKDKDIGQNSEILYGIEPQNEQFWVNATSGEIYTKQSLILSNSAFEIYQFEVIAFDCGIVPLQSISTVIVRLEPYNFYQPMFLPFRPLIAVPYFMAVGSEVVQFTAIDHDVNNSVGIEYVSNGGNASDFFSVQADNGKVILNQSLVKSAKVFLTLLVLATDQGIPSLSSKAEITFEITGRNTNSPSFTEPDITFSVPEDLSVGSVIGNIQAEDEDYGSNGAIMYSITPEGHYLPFSVGETSGLITLTRGLDFEIEGIFHLYIKAKDGGWVSKTGTLNVIVVVVDINDNPPVFSSSEFTASLLENSAIGTNVLDVMATDADSGTNAHIFYSFIAGHVDKFAIDSRNGTITTLYVFDYEQEQIFDLTIKASNIGDHTLFSLAHIVIKISDVNEFTPNFSEKEFHFLVFKNVPVGTRIGKVAATDDDQGSEGQVFYLMFGQNKYMGFEINKLSGEVYTTGSLRKQGNSHVVLKVLAKNSDVITGMDIDETLVYISVVDTNDAPVFTSALYSVNVTEDSPVGTSVAAVSALDEDSILDRNSFFFSIENGNSNFSFAIDPSVGVVSVNSPLDRELWPVYNLTVIATDNGFPPATGTTYIIVSIDDINDNAPKLTFTEVQLIENKPSGTIVARLNASDSDLPPNQGPFTYWFLNPSTISAFSLTPNGVLLTTRIIDREEVSAYRFLVVVRDAGTPRVSSTTLIHIEIMDVNDNPSFPRNIFIEVKYFGTSFQGGMVGNVHPDDQDESDLFNCAIKSGSHNMFSISNGTCELWSSPFQGEATFNITVEATDQLHFPVNNSIYVNYKGFTNASIDCCILFYVSSPSMEEFLSKKYLRFVKALDSLFNLQASKTHVFGIKHIGSKILLLAAVKTYNGQYLSREVARSISIGHKKLLEAQANVTISHISSDPCFISPCQNGATCNKHIYISQGVAVLESIAVIFVSPRKEVFNCTCPAGFTGTLCEYDIDECHMHPCENEGVCVNTPGNFYCHCQSGFSGYLCSIDVDECLQVKCQNGGTCIPAKNGYYCQCVAGFQGQMCELPIDHCRSTPCIQGRCISSQKGFSCLCPYGVIGVHCEEHSYGFEELSFMEFPPLDRGTNLISLEFATVQKDSLLLYNPGGSASREFFALQILSGALQLSFDLGSGPVILQTNKQVADGYFHSVTVRRIGNMGSLQVDSCTDVERIGFCFSQSDGGSLERTLDVSSNLTFGGLRTFGSILLDPAHLKTHDFVGCIHEIHVNGILLRPSMALATYNILDSCPRPLQSPCHSKPCKNGGRCLDRWSHYICECKSPLTGSTCGKEVSEELVLRFNGNQYIEYVIKERFKRDNMLKELLVVGDKENIRDQRVINIKFKTQENGGLMFVVGRTGKIMLTIKDRKPVYISKDKLSEFPVDSVVADGVWHVLSLFSDEHNTFLLLDAEPVLNITGQTLNLSPVSVDKIVLGAALTDDSKLQQTGFTGCVQYFTVSGYTLPVGGHSVMVDVFPSSSLIRSGCSSPGFCLSSACSWEDTAGTGCLSAHCQRPWRCGSVQENNMSCICLHNVSEYTCDICSSRAESRYRCLEAKASLPLWIIAVILPLISILVIIGMRFALSKVRQQNAESQSDMSPPKTEQGTNNIAFCSNYNTMLTEATSAKGDKQHDPVCADQQSLGLEFYPDNGLSSVQPKPNSDPEYYEIGGNSSARCSDAASLKLNWHHNLYGAKCAKAEPKRWGDLRMFLAEFKKEQSSEERAKGPMASQKVTPGNKKLWTSAIVQPSICHKKTFTQAEFQEHVQCLTFEEICKLNTPLKQRICHETCVSSDSETDRTFTGAASEVRQFSAARKYTDEQSRGSSSLFKQTCHSAGQHNTEMTASGMFEQWQSTSEMCLPLSDYALVFEDIACLPTKSSQSYDMQSDIEEII